MSADNSLFLFINFQVHGDAGKSVAAFIVFSTGNAEVVIGEKCHNGWKNFGVRCYKFFSQANWITAEEGGWLWSDGTAYDYANWCADEPNNINVENCGEISWTSDRCWNDAGCSASVGYVCAKDL
ncbi:hypothetical protein G5714_006579 [Onychostoma macrolepis]|uniref:C-type lectin domain-containing protein n=1 Tax=Onychostoma macrolepis TaxID=369639 RepID=A0A7J6CXK1_9TELE|nr:hypothetical protein G5714_006579 [Onychostoma macrolepis]